MNQWILTCRKFFVWGALLTMPGTGAAAEQKFLAAEVGGVPEQYLVVLADGAARGPGEGVEVGPSVGEVATELADLYGGSVERSWQHALRGFQIRISEQDAQRLAFDPAIRWVQQDRKTLALENLPLSCYGFDPGTPGSDKRSAQSIVCDDPDPRNPNRNCIDNWGLDRIDQTSGTRDGFYNYTTTAHSVHVFVLDTGILAEHQQFEEFNPGTPTRVINGYNAILGGDPANTTDCHGHGTHVAGIIGGDTTGVAKNVLLHPVKFLDSCPNEPQGGTAGDVVTGLDWIHANHDPGVTPAVVNYSGGNGSAAPGTDPASNDPAVQAAVANLLTKGFSFVQAAGNQRDDLNGQPTDACQRSLGGVAGLEAVIIAGGTDTNQGLIPVDGRWIREVDDPSGTLCTASSHKDCGSNSGSCVDIWAPAAHIISAFADNASELCRLSGTSMAAPHVTGAVALYLQSNRTATPAQVQQAIVDGATCGVLDADPSSPYYIGDGSPNLLLNSLRNGGGPGGCNQPPVCQDDAYSTPRDTLLAIYFNNLLSNDSDPDGDNLWVIDYDLVTAQGGTNDEGHVSGFNYTPPLGFVGPDSMSYTIRDRPDSSGLTATCTIDIEVTPPAGSTLAFGTETIDEQIRTVSLTGFTKPIVVMGPPSFVGVQATTVRVRNVTTSSFQHNIQEWDYLNVFHTNESIGYLVLEAGPTTLGNLAADAGSRSVTHNWTTVRFGRRFANVPVVVTQVASFNDSSAVTTRVRNVTMTSFQVRLQEEDAADGTHAAEYVHYIAVEPGITTIAGSPLVVGNSGDLVTHAFFTVGFGTSVSSPAFIADMQTTDGGDAAALRYQNLTSTSVEVKVEEEQSLDSETNHTTENIGYIVLGN